ncbi:MAG: hypothetical protein V1682_00415 [Candidatus Omnitrophota bacterium]
MKAKCINCGERKRCRDSFTSWVFFMVGIIATIAIRMTLPLEGRNPLFGKIAWYIGVAGFLIFFLYKFKVDHSRSRMIRKAGLSRKIDEGKALSPEDYRMVRSVLCSIDSGKDLINYALIFLTSVIAIALALYQDFVR